MTMLRIERFGGMVPIWEDRLLPDYHAAYSENVNLLAGRLQPLAALVPIRTLASPATRSVFRVPKAKPGIDNMQDSYWLEFDEENVWVVRNPTVGLDDDGRYYWATGSSPPGYTTGARLAAGSPPLVLGIPSPATAPGVVPSGGTGPTETRAYVYTWVSASGEEGPPSPPTVTSSHNDASWDLTLTAPTVPNTTDRTLTTTRIYRTVTNQQGVAEFFFVTELPIATLLFSDTIGDDVVSLNDLLASTNWTAPPTDLKGLVSLPNGMIAGFRNNEIWFCEPYRPHAWPPQFVIGVESPIVGLGVQQQSVVILTIGWTYIAIGIRPDAMALTKVSNLEPCTSMGSIVSTPDGVVYTSVNGLIMCSAGVETNVTSKLIRKDQWPKFIYLPNLHATYVNRSYLAFSSPNIGVFQEDAFQTASPPAFATTDPGVSLDGALISLDDERMAFEVVASTSPVIDVMQDIWTGEAMLIRGSQVQHLDFRKAEPIISNYRWRSKTFQTPHKDNWAAAKVFFETPTGLTLTSPTVFRLYADDRLKMEYTLRQSGQQFRLPSGYKSDTMAFEIEGQLQVFNVQIATSARDLRGA